MAKSSQVSTTNQQTPNNTSTSKATTPKLYKIHPLHSSTIIGDKNDNKKNLAVKNYTQPYTREDTQQH